MSKFFIGIKRSFFYIIMSILLGVLWHYIYDWSNGNQFVGMFFPKNESTWEHLKLLFYPVLIISILEYILKRRRDGFIVSRTYGVFYGMAIIVILFYTYMGVVGIEYAPINIIIYIIGVFAAYGMSEKYYERRSSTFRSREIITILLILLMVIAFAVFSFYTPDINIFRVPE